MKTHYKKEANYGKYTIGIRDDYSVEVLEDGKVYNGKVMPLLRDEIAPQVDFKVNPKWNTQDLGRKLVEWIKKIEKSKKINAILINVMYSGSYIKNNLGHECINLFATDSGQHFIYINPLGKIAKDKLLKYNIECVLLGQLVRSGVIKVIAKATGLTILDSTKKIINNTSATDQDSLESNLAKEHVAELKREKVFYGEVFIEDLFDKRKQVLATFKADKVVKIKGNVYLYESDKPTETFTDIQLPSANHYGQKKFHFAKTNPYMYFPETNDNGDPMDDYMELNEIIGNTTIWENDSVEKFSSTTSGNQSISMIEIMRKEDSELAYSNMIAYWLNYNQAIIKEFVEFLNKEKRTSIPVPKNNPVINIEREHENIDILINYDNTHIIIENKINAGISVYNPPKSGYYNQLTKYRDEFRKELLKKGISNHRIHCFLLTPDYRNVDPHNYDKEYSPIKYSDLYVFFNKNTAIKQDPLGKEFCKALALHKEVVDNSNFINMQRRMAQAIASKKKKQHNIVP